MKRLEACGFLIMWIIVCEDLFLKNSRSKNDQSPIALLSVKMVISLTLWVLHPELCEKTVCLSRQLRCAAVFKKQQAVIPRH